MRPSGQSRRSPREEELWQFFALHGLDLADIPHAMSSSSSSSGTEGQSGDETSLAQGPNQATVASDDERRKTIHGEVREGQLDRAISLDNSSDGAASYSLTPKACLESGSLGLACKPPQDPTAGPWPNAFNGCCYWCRYRFNSGCSCNFVYDYAYDDDDDDDDCYY